MAVYLQPCHWYEHDVNFKYVVDVFGRTHEGDIARLRLTGFCPYFYLRAETGETTASIASALTAGTKKQLNGIRITEERKLDAMKGFNGLTPTKVWKLSFPALWMFKLVARELKAGMRIGSRRVFTEDIYEAGLPPYLRLFHELDLSPASPLKFIADAETPPEGCRVDLCYTALFRDVEPYTKINIPLYVLSYDIETYSSIPGQFPMATNPRDEVIQIGMSFRWSDDLMTPVEKYVLVSGECCPSTDPSIKFISCRNEQDLLLKFQNTIHAENPDIIAGYNTFGFDDGYIAERCQRHKLELQLGREDVQSYSGDFVKTEKKTFELASGKYAVRYFDLCGRMAVDLLLVTRREQNLDSYKLDSVASTFLRDKVTSVKQLNDTTVEISTKSTRGLYVGNYVRFDVVTNTYNPYRDGEKFQVETVSPKSFTIRTTEAILMDLSEDHRKKLEWCFSKDDISLEDMMISHTGTPEQRAEVAKYCIQDCDLVATLMAKLDTLVNARGMADVCRVPIDYIFLRGQGIKIFSAVVYNAHKRGQIIMTQESIDGETSYEGAIVLPPKIGLYLDQPIPVLDFNSLYPSNMIAFNLSPDTLVYVKTFNMDGRKIRHEGADGPELQQLRDAGYIIDEVSYDTHNDNGESIGRVTCGFVQPRDSDPRTVGLLPLTLDILLKKRKETRKLMEVTEDDAQISVLNGLQLAYKVVANSVYGQCGSRTSAIRKMEVAACTTALGRARIHEAKTVVESEFGATVIYGDTDSIFVQFPTKDLAESIDLGKKAAEKITSLCRKPYKIEYEKTFYPFIIFCRKRYVGLMYEDDITKCKRKTMGIALKRRDNAPIVKDIFGGALDMLLEERDLRKAHSFVKESLVNVMQNKVPLEKYVITKQLRDDYKNPEQIAHRVLADRMTERDPGNKPQVGDRIPYVYIASKKDERKQGDRIEHLDYVRKHSLKPDVEFYITNQLQNPLAQLFALGIEQLEGYKPKNNYEKMFKEYRERMDEEESTLTVLKHKEKELDSLLFLGAPYLTKHKKGPMDAFLKR
jgi:DNA polymerase elongation subunit (family B)